MILPVEIASYASRLDLSKRAFARGILPTSFTYTIDIDERGEFRATVYDPRGREVMGIDEQIFEDGYMRHKEDLRGLAAYLEAMGIGGPDTQVRTASYAPRNASFARRASSSRFARFAEGDTAGFNKWLKTQPKDVQDDWDANKEKYGDKFKTASDFDSFENLRSLMASNKGLTAHLASPDNKGFALCGQRLYPNTTVKDYTEATCYYCLLGFNKNLERMIQKNHENRGYGDKFKTAGNKMAKTFAQARADIFAHLKAEGWTVKEYDASRMKPMKVPWAKSPNGQDTLWFKAQAVYLNVHSLFEDIRNVTPQAFLKTVHDTIKIRKYGHKLNG